nr:MAG TPA: hypothetical protein [Caudoviricetes sp.]
MAGRKGRTRGARSMTRSNGNYWNATGLAPRAGKTEY